MSIDRKKYLGQDEVRKLRASTEGWALLDLQHGRQRGIMAWMLIDLALSTGLRVSELAAIKQTDVDLRRRFITVGRLKRRQRVEESLAIGEDLCRHLKEYVNWLKMVRPSAAMLLVGERGPYSRYGLGQLWNDAITRAGLPADYSIHSARHTMAVALLGKTGNLRQVQKQLGHASPVTTANMYADITDEDMRAGVEGLYEEDKP
jgi:integrase